MRYQIVYMKNTPMTTWVSDKEQAHRLAEQLRRVGYSVDVWEHTYNGAHKTNL